MSALSLYRAMANLSAPLVRAHLARRAASGKEDGARLGERLGEASRPRPSGPLLWFHAASMGEAASILPLVARLLSNAAGLNVMVTTGTVTSAALLEDQLPRGAFHQYVPVDLPAAVDAFLDHWRPDAVLWTESEFWPNLIHGIASRHLPLALINGRVSARAFRRWSRFPGPIRAMLAPFRLCLAQTADDAARLRALGAGNVICVGNLKFAAPPLAADEAELARLRVLLGTRPRWLAASTHAGEESAAVAVHRRLAPRLPGLLTIIAPRHPARGAEVAALAAAAGLTVARRGDGAPPNADTGVYVADTIGELGLWYRLADVVFVGGSLVPFGGHNPLEPARLGCAILHGPHMSSFADMAAAMTASGASRMVADTDALGAEVELLLSDGQARRGAMASAARAYADGQAGTLDRVLEAIAPLLPSGTAPSRLPKS
ncbi:MAG TPA: 3-deoxy-D-manno-octulosonic acid transferase [Candidatus Cybelea sp.]|nr:3-deoxy-D-manno-octulosonic acid transferase [Candidatus Cybelea sp.]